MPPTTSSCPLNEGRGTTRGRARHERLEVVLARLHHAAALLRHLVPRAGKPLAEWLRHDQAALRARFRTYLVQELALRIHELESLETGAVEERARGALA